MRGAGAPDRITILRQNTCTFSAPTSTTCRRRSSRARRRPSVHRSLDVVLLATTMKKGRPGTRVEALVRPADLARLEEKILLQFTTLGVKRLDVVRKALPRESKVVNLGGHEIRVKVSTLPDGSLRAKAEFDDLNRVAQETMRGIAELRSEIMNLLARQSDTEAVNRG